VNSAQTRVFFDEYANQFNAIYSNRNTIVNRVINSRFRKSMELRYWKTLEGCTPARGMRVLDLGCGPGHYSIALARQGAEAVGIDFAEGMIALAREQARTAGLADHCEFIAGDFYSLKPERAFDFVVVMGVMDYIDDPKPLLAKIISMADKRAFISFPQAGGILAWQRRLRYRSRCPLYLYSEAQIQELLSGTADVSVKIEPIARDFFVTISKEPTDRPQQSQMP
jgi:2-polyprenyl-3-methyl-5-hydroxy-6-metoxy-1,4-benzoquinol methylase